MSRSDPLGIRSHDPLEKFRAAAERQEEEFAEARRAREREERRAIEASEIAQLRAEFQAELARLAERRGVELEAVGEAIAKYTDEVIDRFEAHSNRMRSSILDAVEARFTALEMALKAAEARVAKGSFQFAREREGAGEVVDLPNPLRPRRLDS
jgi:hypothetical protein